MSRLLYDMTGMNSIDIKNIRKRVFRYLHSAEINYTSKIERVGVKRFYSYLDGLISGLEMVETEQFIDIKNIHQGDDAGPLDKKQTLGDILENCCTLTGIPVDLARSDKRGGELMTTRLLYFQKALQLIPDMRPIKVVYYINREREMQYHYKKELAARLEYDKKFQHLSKLYDETYL